MYERSCGRWVSRLSTPPLEASSGSHGLEPYLLRNLDITGANSVWCSNISYIPMTKGFCFLVASMDWTRRKVLSWRLSNTLDASFCMEALEEALQKYGTPLYSTPTREANLHQIASREYSKPMALKSAWTDRAGGGITSL